MRFSAYFLKMILAMAVIGMASCSQEETAQSVRDQIAARKKEVNDLNRKIEELEKKLAVMESGEEDISRVPVAVMELAYEPFRHYIQVSGTAEAVKEAFISPEISGQLRALYVNEGDYVTKGQLLARLNTEVTESSIAEVESSLELATVTYEKQKRLWEKGIGSEMQYLNARNGKETLEQKLQTLQAQLDMALIKSPVNGVVDQINLKTGELALPGNQLMRVVNLDELYINADVSESYLAEVREGEMVKVEFPVYPELKLEVPIYRKGNVINPNNRTFAVQLRLNNPDKKLKPNILSVIHINDFSADSALVIPSALIKKDLNGFYLYVAQQNSEKWIARKVYVETGRSFLDKTMVTGGLNPGQQVIVQGYNMVSDGAEIAIKSGNAS